MLIYRREEVWFGMAVIKQKTYVDVAPESVGQLIEDLEIDLRDVPHTPPSASKQPDGKYAVHVTLRESGSMAASRFANANPIAGSRY